MRKILLVGVFLCAAVAVAPHDAGACNLAARVSSRGLAIHADLVYGMEAAARQRAQLTGDLDTLRREAARLRHDGVMRSPTGARLSAYGPAELGRDYGFMLMVLAIPTAVLAWGVRRTVRLRVRVRVED
jgi:hypothetical protein